MRQLKASLDDLMAGEVAAKVSLYPAGGDLLYPLSCLGWATMDRDISGDYPAGCGCADS